VVPQAAAGAAEALAAEAVLAGAAEDSAEALVEAAGLVAAEQAGAGSAQHFLSVSYLLRDFC
jgi:hypothetical protein